MPVESGHVIAERYRLVRPIGKGAQAAVWIADHLALGSQVAVKLMDPELVEQGDARERFRREATAAAQLRSAHVVHILDHGIDNGQPFMVMELLDGEDLFQRLERKGRLTLAEASVIVTQIARALARAHAAGIVHRDLKPENVFLVPNEDEEVAKVLDFGVAKFLEAGAAQRRTSAGTLLGTPHYMSPEQVRGVGEIDHRSDLWSLGVIAFQLTVGDLPFESEGVGDLLIKITMEKIPVPSKAYAPLPKTFDDWFAKACHRDPDLRFQTGRELAAALARVAGLIPAAESLRGLVVPVKGRSEPPGFDVDFDEVPSIPPPAPPPPEVVVPAVVAKPAPRAATPPAVAKAALSAVAAAPTEMQSEDIDDEWPDEPPAPSIPPPPVAATPPPRPVGAVVGAKPAAPAKPAAAPARPAVPPARLAIQPAKPATAAAPAARTATPPPPLAKLAKTPSESAESVRTAAPAAAVSSAIVSSDATADAKTALAKTEAETAARASDPAPVESAAAPEAAVVRAAPTPAPRVEPAAALAAPPPPPRPSATRTSSPPSSARASDPPRSKNQLSSTISGAAGDVIPPPELDGSRKKRAVLWVAAIALLGAGAIAVAVVQSQGTSKPAPGNAQPQSPTAQPRPTVATPPAPALAPAPPPSSSASGASSSSAAVDPGTSKRPIKGGSTAAPTAPRSVGPRKQQPAKDGEIVIDVPLPDREVPVPPAP